jgi:6-pyruvoyltetrahydropterin/6-carboxytetrahydropterin synthase
MFITRKAEFSASHVCRLPALDDAANFEIYGPDSYAHGHGHNYVIEVTVEGTPDAVTGMIVDLKHLKQILENEVIEPMDHRFLNHEVPPFAQVVPTAENLASEIWQRLEPRISTAGARLHRVRLWETPELYVDVTAKS